MDALDATASLFDVLGVRPYLGHRSEVSAQQPGRGQVAVLSYRLWQQVFGGDPGVIGRTVRLDGKPYRVIAVMPKGFSGFDAYSPAVELWTPYTVTAAMKSESYRRIQDASVIARLKPDASLQQARAQVDAALHRAANVSGIMQQAVQAGLKWRVQSYHGALVGDQSATLYLLQAAVLLVLLIACVNVANLLLARILVLLQGDIAMFSVIARVRGKARRVGNGRSPWQAAQRCPRARAITPTNEWINKRERLCAPITALRSLARALAMPRSRALCLKRTGALNMAISP